MSRMLHKKPSNSEELVVKWTEFLAEFKTLPNLDPVSKNLNILQLYSLDSIGALLGILVFALFSTYMLLRTCICWLCCRPKKAHKPKTE